MVYKVEGWELKSDQVLWKVTYRQLSEAVASIFLWLFGAALFPYPFSTFTEVVGNFNAIIFKPETVDECERFVIAARYKGYFTDLCLTGVASLCNDRVEVFIG